MNLSAFASSAKQRIRLFQILEAAEHAALTPIDIVKLHAFAYLSDILSPVWSLLPFDRVILKTGKPPYYPDLQFEVDRLVAMGLFEATDLSYQEAPDGSMVFQARYSMLFSSPHGQRIRDALADDVEAVQRQSYLDALARALASLRDDEISAAAAEDASYDDAAVSPGDIVEFADTTRGVRTHEATASFDALYPDVNLTPARRLYMYAHYLGRKVHASA